MNKLKLILPILSAALIGYYAGRHSSDPDVQAINTGHAQGDHLPEIAASTRDGYVCPMHAEIVTSIAGSCPICGMDLVKVTHVDQPDAGTYPEVRIDPAVVHNLGIRTEQVVVGDMRRNVETIGKITRIDPTARRIMTPPMDGELIYIADKQDGDTVKAGELLFTIMSEELAELEAAFRQAYQSGDRAAASAMIPRLRDMGISPEQIALLQAGTGSNLPAEVYAFEDSFIYARRGRVGEQARTGFTVFNLGGNYQVIEVTAEIFERQWGWVEEGQPATMKVRGLPGKVFNGKVVRVEPPVGYTTRSLEVALKFNTDDPGLAQSMFAHVSILAPPKKNVLMISRQALIRTGAGERVVLAQTDGHYQPVPVVAGEEAGDIIEILAGLAAGDRVVASGQFLIDSESNVLSGLRRMSSGADAP